MKKWVIGLVLTGLAIGAIVWVTWPKPTVESKPSDLSAGSVLEAGVAQKSDWANRLEDARARITRSAALSPGMKTSAPGFAQAAVEGMTIYSQGEWSEAKRWLEGQGLNLHPSMKDPIEGPKTWRTFGKCLQGAVFYPETTEVVRVSQGGKPMPQPEPRVEHGNFVGTRGYDNPGAVDTSQPGVDVWEVRMQADLTSLEGAPFRATVGLSFAQRPGTSRWVLCGVSIYDVPSPTRAFLPPF